MNKQLSLLLLLVCFSAGSLMAQTGFNYQAVMRDGSGNVMANETVDIDFSIREGSAGGTEVYNETHSGVNTDDFGLVNLVIGEGSVNSGSFSGIDWGSDDHFVNVQVDGNDLGTQQLQAVPYAMYSMNSGGGLWTDQGSYINSAAPVSVGVGSTTAEWLNVNEEGTLNNEVASFSVDTLIGAYDVLQLDIGDGSDDDVQFIEANFGFNTVFRVDVDGTVNTEGKVTRESVTDTANLVPIAYGSIEDDGTIAAGTGNFTVTKNGTGEYDIAIDDENYNFLDYIASVTANGINSSDPGYATQSAGGGALRVRTWNGDTGNTEDKNFHFVVYKP